jgi:type IV pilus assembly protein PilA
MLSAILVEDKTENRFNKLMKDETGLSLVELLAVVVIIAILSGIGVIAIGNIIQNAREDAAISDVQTAYSAAGCTSQHLMVLLVEEVIIPSHLQL